MGHVELAILMAEVSELEVTELALKLVVVEVAEVVVGAGIGLSELQLLVMGPNRLLDAVIEHDTHAVPVRLPEA